MVDIQQIVTGLVIVFISAVVGWVLNRFLKTERDLNRIADLMRKLVWLVQRYDKAEPKALLDLKLQIDKVRDEIWHRRGCPRV